jgi:hypothetical protein
MNSIKVLTVTMALLAGISVAQAQDMPQARAGIQDSAQITSNNQTDSNRLESHKSETHSGYNTGPTKSNVPGCTGPISFCNIYFGSWDFALRTAAK